MNVIKKIKFFFQILSKTKFEFKLPQESKILIYDGNKTDKIILFLKNYKLKILYIRWEVLNIPCFFLALTKGKGFMINYIDLFIKYTKPKLIITFCDNDHRFLNLSKRHNSIKTLFLQNGWRSNYLDIFEEFILNNRNNINYHVDYQLVFGQAIGNEYKKFVSGKTLNFGSFLNNYLKKKYSPHKNNLAYISQYEMSFENQKFKLEKKILNFNSFFMECDKLIVNYLQYYAKKNNKNFYIIPKSNKNNLLFRSREKEYFENLSKDEIKFLDFDNCLSSYHATDYSDVVVSVDSSLGYESLSRGNKTVFFSIRGNLCGIKNFNRFGWPLEYSNNGIFWTNNPNKKTFLKILDYAFNTSEKAWRENLKIFRSSELIERKNNDLLIKIINKELGNVKI